MASFYRARVGEFLSHTEEHVLACLATAYANRGYTRQYAEQTLTWERDIRSLRASLEQCVLLSDSAKSWGLLLEFSILRKELRIDAVLLIRDLIVVLEAKTGKVPLQAKRQIEEYALLLHYFHKASTEHRIVPIIVSPDAAETNLATLNQHEFFPQLSTYWVAQVISVSWQRLSSVLSAIENNTEGQIIAETWDNSPYFPVPSIIEAAVALRSGLSIREIAHSEASEHEIENVRQSIQAYVDQARIDKHHAICFFNWGTWFRKDISRLVRQWLQKRPRYHLHFTPTHASWLNQVQRWFALLTQRQIKRGSHRSVQQLETAIREFIAAHNHQPQPFRWTKSADQILASIARFATATLAPHSPATYTRNQ